jgi:hypothetical protein
LDDLGPSHGMNRALVVTRLGSLTRLDVISMLRRKLAPSSLAHNQSCYVSGISPGFCNDLRVPLIIETHLIRRLTLVGTTNQVMDSLVMSTKEHQVSTICLVPRKPLDLSKFHMKRVRGQCQYRVCHSIISETHQRRHFMLYLQASHR